MLTDVKNAIINNVDEKHTKLLESIQEIKATAEKALFVAEEAKEKINSLVQRVKLNEEALAEQKEHYIVLTQKHLALHEELKKLDASLDDQTNRNMRKTLVIKGVKEPKKESWSDTENTVINLLGKHLNIHPDDAYNMIEHAHRGGTLEPRSIFIRFESWEDSEQVKDEFFKLNINKKTNTRIVVDQLYSDQVNERRNNAMTHRRTLIAAGTIVGGYMAYPATLMGKMSKNNKEYIKIQSF